MYKYFSVLVFCMFFFACDSNSGKQADSTTTTQGKAMESIPFETISYVFENCDYVDYVFYNTNFSISQNEKASIQGAIAQISKTPATLDPNCKAIGRVFYQIDGKNHLEADLYFQEGCYYYVFLENNKPKYANVMTDEGIAYFKNIMARAQSVQPQ